MAILILKPNATATLAFIRVYWLSAAVAASFTAALDLFLQNTLGTSPVGYHTFTDGELVAFIRTFERL